MAVRIYRTQTAGSTTTWTFSAWIKRSTLGTSQQIFAANTGSADPEITCYFNTSDQIDWYNYISGATLGHLKTTRVFRDVGAWYHVVMVWDTTNVTGDDRMQIWVNGVRETVLTINANPASSQTSQVNTASSVMNIGTNGFSSAKDLSIFEI